MKRIITLLWLLIAITSFAQVKKQFTTASWGEKRWGLLYTPADQTKKYPIIIFFHGRGEVGTTSTDADRLTAWGPLHFVKNAGWKPDYVIVSLQDQYWTPQLAWYKHILKSDPDILKVWDGKNILAMGISAGGHGVLYALRDSFATAYIPMSPAGIGDKINFTPSTRILAFHAMNDNLCPYKVSSDLVNAANTAHPGSAVLVDMKNDVTGEADGHGNWNKYASPDYLYNGKNIYQWAFEAVTAPPPIPPAKKIFATLYLPSGRKLTVYDDGSSQLD